MKKAELLSEVRKYGIMAKWDLGQVDTQKLIFTFRKPQPNLSVVPQLDFRSGLP
ncbi:MAG: hypothetical protein ABI425_05875 [Patescibacteria group bacterium]